MLKIGVGPQTQGVGIFGILVDRLAERLDCLVRLVGNHVKGAQAADQFGLWASAGDLRHQPLEFRNRLVDPIGRGEDFGPHAVGSTSSG